MKSPIASELIDDYKLTTWLIHQHVDGVSDDASLLQLPFEANCLNWVVGHILSRRNSVLEALGLPMLWDEDTLAKYKSGSEPVTSAKGAHPFRLLLADLDRSLQLISKALETATDDDLERIVQNDRGTKSVIEHLQGFHWHETYHVGQLDILRAFVNSKA